MKIVFTLIALLSFCSFIKSQNSKHKSRFTSDSLYAQDIRQLRNFFPDLVVHDLEEKQEFDQNYLLNNIKGQRIHYPTMAREGGIQGKVYCRFIVNTDRSISDIKVIRGIGGGCDEECMRILSGLEILTPEPFSVNLNHPVYEKISFTFLMQ